MQAWAKFALFVASAAMAGNLSDKVQPPIEGTTLTPALCARSMIEVLG